MVSSISLLLRFCVVTARLATNGDFVPPASCTRKATFESLLMVPQLRTKNYDDDEINLSVHHAVSNNNSTRVVAGIFNVMSSLESRAS